MTRSKTPQTPFPMGPEAMGDAMKSMAGLQAAALGPMNWMGPASMEAFQATMQEMSSFVSDRLQKDIATQQALLSCKTPDDVQRVQSEAVKQAFEDYRAEVERLSEIARKFVEDATRLAPPDSGPKSGG